MSLPDPVCAPRTPTAFNPTRRSMGRVFSFLPYLTILAVTPAIGMLAGYLIGGNY